jgi:TusA-related sulfurtransferase
MTTPSIEVDATGLDCPMPLLLAKRALNGMTAGQTLTLRATDSASQRDFQVFTDQTGHKLLSSSEEAGVYTFLIQKQ